MDESVLDEHELLQQLNHFYKVRLFLDEERRELFMRRDEAFSLPEEITDAIKEHREALLKRTLFLETLQRFDGWMAERGGGDRDAQPHVSGRLGLGSHGTADRLNEIWDSSDLDAFEEALSAYVRAGARAFLRAAEHRPSTRQPALTP